MSTTAQPQPAPAPESYATFWEPLAGDSDATPVAVATPADAPGSAKDAYLEFTEIAEGVAAVAHAKRS